MSAMNQAKAEFFDQQVRAAWAAAEYGPAEQPKLNRLIREAGLGTGQRILEPGCGTGRLTQVLARVVGPAGRVVALDISSAMVAACRQRLAGSPQVAVLHAALEELEARDASFDRVVCHQVFPHFDDKPLALRIIRRLLRPGGVLAVAHFINSAEINQTHRKAGTAVERDLLPGPGPMRRLLAEAGLEVEMLADDELGYFLRARRN